MSETSIAIWAVAFYWARVVRASPLVL